jgi:CDP-paratose 2-epimerase
MPTALSDTLRGATVLVTGGAGFVGGHLAMAVKREAPDARVVAFDNLRRRGSELNPPRLREHGVDFVHGDIRNPDDFSSLPEAHLLLECSAEPSVQAGYHASPRYVIDTNLSGTVNCLEFARRHRADVVFLSTSRVYPIAGLNAIAVAETPTRFEIAPDQRAAGVSAAGIQEGFALDGSRSLYGATKLASELLLHEYGAMYGLRYVINRLGVVTGPGQMGKVDQGVFALWMARHYFGGPLAYTGWGGTGKQVRDLVHVADVWDLVRRQIGAWDRANGRVYNAGGGRPVSLSLCETTELCRAISGRRVAIAGVPDTHPSDVRIFITDHRAVTDDLGWRPTHDPRAILEDIYRWLRADEARLAPIFTAGR